MGIGYDLGSVALFAFIDANALWVFSKQRNFLRLGSTGIWDDLGELWCCLRLLTQKRLE